MRRNGLKLVLALLTGLLAVTPGDSFAGDRPTDESLKLVSTETVTQPDPTKDEIYLLEQAQKSFRIVKSITLPSRVYLKKSITVKDALLPFLSSRRGKLTTPERFLLSGSVLRGDRIGGLKERYYVLIANGSWRRSEGPEVYKVKDDVENGSEYIVLPSEHEDASPASVAATTSTH